MDRWSFLIEGRYKQYEAENQNIRKIQAVILPVVLYVFEI
jgi:hypothetical protein